MDDSITSDIGEDWCAELSAKANALRFQLETTNAPLPKKFPLKALKHILDALHHLQFGNKEEHFATIEYSYARILLVFSEYFDTAAIFETSLNKEEIVVFGFEKSLAELVNMLKDLRRNQFTSKLEFKRALPIDSLSQLAVIKPHLAKQIEDDSNEIKVMIDRLIFNIPKHPERALVYDYRVFVSLVSAESCFPKVSKSYLKGLQSLIQGFPKIIRKMGSITRASASGIGIVLKTITTLHSRVDKAIVKAIDEIGVALEGYGLQKSSKGGYHETDISLPAKFDFQIDAYLSHLGGLHARPSKVVVQLLADFDCKLYIQSHNQFGVDIVEAESVMELIMLCAAHGEYLTIYANGREAKEACIAVKMFIEANFDMHWRQAQKSNNNDA